MARVEYFEYIHSEAWKSKRLLVLKRDRFRCKRCGTRGCSHNRLSVHHHTYANLGREKLEDLATLCWFCHGVSHGKCHPVVTECKECRRAIRWALGHKGGPGGQWRGKMRRRLSRRPGNKVKVASPVLAQPPKQTIEDELEEIEAALSARLSDDT
jgi:hypothetical protein